VCCSPGALDIFVLSSRYEGFPNVLLEAMANGCAAVSFDCLSGPADVIQPGLNGVLVTPGDCTGLAQEIDKLLQNESERARLAENAKAVKTTFSEARVMGEWMSILQRYLGVDRKKDET